MIKTINTLQHVAKETSLHNAQDRVDGNAGKIARDGKSQQLVRVANDTSVVDYTDRVELSEAALLAAKQTEMGGDHVAKIKEEQGQLSSLLGGYTIGYIANALVGILKAVDDAVKLPMMGVGAALNYGMGQKPTYGQRQEQQKINTYIKSDQFKPPEPKYAGGKINWNTGSINAGAAQYSRQKPMAAAEITQQLNKNTYVKAQGVYDSNSGKTFGEVGVGIKVPLGDTGVTINLNAQQNLQKGAKPNVGLSVEIPLNPDL